MPRRVPDPGGVQVKVRFSPATLDAVGGADGGARELGTRHRRSVGLTRGGVGSARVDQVPNDHSTISRPVNVLSRRPLTGHFQPRPMLTGLSR